MKHSKRYASAKTKAENNMLYNAEKALGLVKEIAEGDGKVKFDESIDIAINLNLKAKHTVRDALILPHSLGGGEKKILVFAKGDKATEAEEAGAVYVGDKEFIDKIKDGWLDFDVAIATPDMMKDVGKLGPILGRKGLMPNPKTGTVTFDVKNAVGEFQKGKVEFRADKTGIIHLTIGKASTSADQLFENAKALYKEVLRKKPSDLKGEYVRSIAFSSTMGPGIKIDRNSLN
ncbi:MAG TPA: 50S ribosomal protein L1 [Spirochaetes bacterium]|nr:50S ribosomal protein L1 [Spirochaetota bacterium]